VAELEQTQSDMTDLKSTLSSQSSTQRNSIEMKKIMEENSKLKALTRNRDEILKEVDAKSKNLREAENQLRLT
jgi:hypothetical protein